MSSTIFFFAFIPILAFILLAINLLFAPHNPYQEKNSAFECGFTSFLGQNRTQFSISFFIFALLFLLFDLEILLVYPYLVSAYTNETYGLVIILIFLLALTLGFAFELGKKALSIDSRQTSIRNKNSVAVSMITKSKNNTLGMQHQRYYSNNTKKNNNIMTFIYNSRFYNFALKIFNYYFLIRVLTIFSMGLISRYVVNSYYNINVFVDYANPISLIYYLSFGLITVSLFDFFTYIENKGIHSLLMDLRKLFLTIQSFMFNYNKSKMGGVTPSNVLFAMDNTTPEPSESKGESSKSVDESNKSVDESNKSVDESSKAEKLLPDTALNRLQELGNLPEDGSPGREIDKNKRYLSEEEIDARYKAGLYFCDKDRSESFRTAVRNYTKIEDLPDNMSEKEKDKIFTEGLNNYLEKRNALQTHDVSKAGMYDPLFHITDKESEKNDYIEKKHNAEINPEIETKAAEDDL